MLGTDHFIFEEGGWANAKKMSYTAFAACRRNKNRAQQHKAKKYIAS